MLTGAAGPGLNHILKSVEKNPRTESWMQDKDGLRAPSNMVELSHFLIRPGVGDGPHEQGPLNRLVGPIPPRTVERDRIP